jgi:prophage DNA circulation protein
MYKYEAEEATPIMRRALNTLLGALPPPPASDPDLSITRANFRNACGSLIANAQRLIQNDEAGPPLDNCFDLAVQSRIQLTGLRSVRDQVYSEIAVSIGARLIKNSLIEMTLAHAARVLVDMTFTSRDQVDYIKKLVQAAFAPAEETAADEMDQMTYRALIELHAAVIFFLTETARPLPRMLAWQFSLVMPTLMLAQRLYYDAGRADELREENRVVHPAFSPRIGRALSH